MKKRPEARCAARYGAGAENCLMRVKGRMNGEGPVRRPHRPFAGFQPEIGAAGASAAQHGFGALRRA